jgi:CheY-like chemotaxis protein
MPELMPRIFDAFEQGDPAITRAFGGLGLGLAISRALMELHGGSIRAASEGRGKGASFIVSLPVESRQPLPEAIAPGPVPKAEPQQLRLLVVEDHADTARTLGMLLRRAGFVVTTAADVAGALRTAGQHPFDVIISDVGLPDGTGYDLMKQIALRHGMPGIAMSGYGLEEDVAKSLEAGFSEHLVKPVRVSQLEQAVRRVVGRKAVSGLR